ncbi:hypothetical protein HPB49_025194 [Dermacentor silvarum]|uniref:Uncharacterized protein n=1 Tax=Dermacentor silvarum TaxID=543639 RepID=A0ACB8C693_DERSI|nr:hypothetical protein HPB49_025194 [Dermacentor silvarum]
MNDKLLGMGIYNTASELLQAHYMNQVIRLACARAGRATLEAVGINPPTQVASKRSLPPEWQQEVIICPLPRNVHPIHHENSRAARAKDYNKYSDQAGVFFVDVTGSLHNHPTATFVHRGQVVECISATGIDITAMEEDEPPLSSRIPGQRIVTSQEVKSATSHSQYCNRLRPIVKTVSGNSCCGYQGTREFEAMRLLMAPPENFYTETPPIPPQHNFSLTRTIPCPCFII